MDGHSGIENKEVNRGGSGGFQLVLSFLRESDGRGHFIIHATSGIIYGPRLKPLQFLQDIGFTHFHGECNFYHNQCFYRHFAEIQYDDMGFQDFRQNDYIHSAFKRFADEEISKLYGLQLQMV